MSSQVHALAGDISSMYVCLSVCLSVCMYVCMYASMHAWIDVRMLLLLLLFMLLFMLLCCCCCCCCCCFFVLTLIKPQVMGRHESLHPKHERNLLDLPKTGTPRMLAKSPERINPTTFLSRRLLLGCPWNLVNRL